MRCTLLLALLSILLARNICASDDPVVGAVNSAVSFWENRNNPQKLAYWREILAALEGGAVSDDLMERVALSFDRAVPGGKMYGTWRGVHAALSAIRDAGEEPESSAPPEGYVAPEPDVPGMHIIGQRSGIYDPAADPGPASLQYSWFKGAAKDLKDVRERDEYRLDEYGNVAEIDRVESVSEGEDDYLSFGYARDESGWTGVFYRGADPVTSAEIDKLSGTATYVGVASGTWHGRVTALQGTFEGILHLTANFWEETVGGRVTVTGMEEMAGRHDGTSDKTMHFGGIDLGVTGIMEDGTFFRRERRGEERRHRR